MPDHPSWPAELVEKAAAVIADATGGVESFRRFPVQQQDEYKADALAVLSALSGDLVPREEARALAQRTAAANGEASIALSQADALAEALEEMVREFVAYAGEADAEHSGYLLDARSALASYRSKPAPGETK